MEMAEAEAADRATCFAVQDNNGASDLKNDLRETLRHAFYRGAEQGNFHFEPCRVWLLAEEPEQGTILFDLISELNGYPDGNVLLVRDDALSGERRDLLRAAGAQPHAGITFQYYGDEDEVQYDAWCGWPSRCMGLALTEPVDTFKPGRAPSPRN
jgi:hypothetical protein